jgi:hypothetical protein
MGEGTMSEDTQDFHVTDWLADGIRGMRHKLSGPRGETGPACIHLRNARREVLLAMRSLLDRAIERTEAEPTIKKKTTKIKVE